ncbi:MAG TPA: IS66 family transposase [Steroidobacteraceae bacterium]|jgi:transposase
MDELTCPGCRELLKRNGELEARIHELEAQLGRNASNSSIPPSANPPQAPPPVRKQPTGRKPGGQPGHAPHLRHRLPAERLTEPTVHYWPPSCAGCQQPLPAVPHPDDPEPRWHQVVELPELPVQVTEYQAHGCTCDQCGRLTWAQLPEALRRHHCGPRLTGIMSYLTGVLHVSKRGVEEFVETVCQVPLALGTISHLEQEMSGALAAAHAEAQQAVQAADAKNVDETGWKQAGKKRWLWGAATALVACFVITPTRGAAGLAALLGKTIKGIICSDRWSVYGQLKLGLRQLCWAHLKRDFQKLVDRGGDAKDFGIVGLDTVAAVFENWHLFRGGGLSRSELQRRIMPLRQILKDWLELGCACTDTKAAAFCANLLAVEPALWTFVRQEGVEPTNNHIERQLRPGVLWRKNAFGCHSETGCRYVERMMTVVQTLRLQKRPVLAFLCQSVLAHRQAQPAPRLLGVQ